jgi:hypothetical protein
MSYRKSKPVIDCALACPSNEFELASVPRKGGPARFIPICHAREVVLQPIFTGTRIEENLVISKANYQTVRFYPCDNCPHIEKMIAEGIYSRSIDFLNHNNHETGR